MKRVTAFLLSMLLLVPLFCAGFAEEELPESDATPEALEEAVVSEIVEPVESTEATEETEAVEEGEPSEETEAPEETVDTEDAKNDEEPPADIVPSLAFVFDEEANIETEDDEITLYLEVGDTFQLAYTVLPEDAGLAWESGDEEIATVSEEGEIEAVSPGEVQITASTADGTSCALWVSIDEPPVSNKNVFVFVEETVTIQAGETFLPSYLVQYAMDDTSSIHWACADEAVASVDEEGLCTGLAAGSTTVTAVLEDGSSASFTLHVLAAMATPEVGEEYKLVEDTHATLLGEGALEELSVETPEILETFQDIQMPIYESLNLPFEWEDDGISELSWQSSNPDIVSVDDKGNIRTTAEGQATIELCVFGAPVSSAEILVYDDIGDFDLVEYTPYDRVLPAGGIPRGAVSVSPDALASSAPFYTYRTSGNNPFNRINIVSEGVSVSISHKSSQSQRVSGLIYIKDKGGANLDRQSSTYQNGGYQLSIDLSWISDGSYEFWFYLKTTSDSSYWRESVIPFEVENGQAYFTLSSVVSYNSGALRQLAQGQAPSDFAYLERLSTNTSADTLAQIQSLTASLTNGKSGDLNKAMAIHEWIVNNIAYDYDMLYSGRLDANPVTVYQNRRGICSGYARLATLMYEYAGINARNVAGYAGSDSIAGASTTNHEWNAVLLDGSWYYIDSTWDSPLSYQNGVLTVVTYPKYRYTLPSLVYFSVDHKPLYLSIYRNDDTSISPIDTSVGGFVERLYKLVFNRTPDDNSELWINGLTSGQETGASAVRGFFLSPEFEQKNISNKVFVTLIYQTCMNRQPGADEVDYWTSYLSQGISRAAVLNEFVKSQEYGKICAEYGITRGAMPLDAADQNIPVTLFVQRLYTIILNRQAERSGVEHWTNYLLNLGGDGKTTAYEFAFSQEFMNAGLSDDEFITRMYRALLNREPEASGMQAWRDEIALNGREGIFDGFADSPEFALVMASYGVK